MSEEYWQLEKEALAFLLARGFASVQHYITMLRLEARKDESLARIRRMVRK